MSALTSEERGILKTIYEHNVETTSQLYELADAYYEKFNEILKKLENVKLIDLKIEYSKGKIQRIFRKYDKEILLDALERVS